MKELKLNPNNPRIITEEKFNKLKKSIKTFTKMLKLRPIIYDENDVIWGGNMRYMALKQLVEEGILEDDEEYYKSITDFTEEEKREFAIRDNVELGTWDDNILANEWDAELLEEWGVPAYWSYEDIDINVLWKENKMPEYGDPSGKKAAKTLYVHFKTIEDMEKFAKLVNQKITEKTKFIWFPEK